MPEMGTVTVQVQLATGEYVIPKANQPIPSANPHHSTFPCYRCGKFWCEHLDPDPDDFPFIIVLPGQ